MGKRIVEVYNARDFRDAARAAGEQVRMLPPSDIEDPMTHYYFGPDYDFFESTGGDLLVGNGYLAIDEGITETYIHGSYAIAE